MSKNKFFSKLRSHRRDRYKPISLRPGARLAASIFLSWAVIRGVWRGVFSCDRVIDSPVEPSSPRWRLVAPAPGRGFF
jgi:hypothetical protein